MRPKSMVLILIALACGLVASIGISQVVDKKSSQDQAQTAPVYVASVDVAIHETLTAQSVRKEEWPIDRIPPGAVTKLEDIDGRKPTNPLYEGEVILGARLLDPNSRVMNSTRIPKGYRVVSVKVQMDSAVSGLLSPGDRVDVLVYFRQNGTTSPSTKTVLTDITVFAINSQITRRTADQEEGAIDAKTVSLTVKPKQAQRLLLAANLGEIKLSLRNNEDDGDEVPEKTGLEDLSPSGNSVFGAAFPPVQQPQQQTQSFQPQGIRMEVISPAGTQAFEFKDRKSLPTLVDQQQSGGLTLPGGGNTGSPLSNNNGGESGGSGTRSGGGSGTRSDDGGFDFDSLGEGGASESPELSLIHI